MQQKTGSGLLIHYLPLSIFMTSTQDIEFGNELEFENMDSSDTADLSPEVSDSIID